MEIINLEAGQVQTVVPGKMESMMTGVYYITKSRKANAEGFLITLTYTDGSKESARMTKEEWEEAEYFNVVGIVQQRAREIQPSAKINPKRN